MADSEREPLVPTDQATVPFYDREIVAVRLPDGRIAAVLASMCDVLQLLTRGQARRIRADLIIAEHLVPARIATAGGPQTMDVLIAWAIPRWLTGIRLGMVAAEKRPIIEAFQREAADILYRHFAQRQLVLPSAGAIVPSVVEVAPPAIAAQVVQLAEQIDTLTGVVTFLQEHMAGLLALPQQVADVGAQIGQALTLLESFAERQDATDAQLAVIDTRTQRLTPAHARTVQELVDRLVHQTRHLAAPLTYATLYGRIKHRFRAGSYKEVPDARFDELLAFLRDELTRATSGEGPEQGSLF
jgi:hypothetical protein